MTEEYKNFGQYEYLAKNNTTEHYQTIKSKNKLQIGQVVLDGNGVEFTIVEEM